MNANARTTSSKDAEEYRDALVMRKKNAAKLKEGYTQRKRNVEKAAITVFTCLFVYNSVRLAVYLWAQYPTLTATDVAYLGMQIFGATILAIFMADLISGLAHWGSDTWGTCETPVFGVFIRSFREHHVAPQAMGDHDWIETNGDNLLMCDPVAIWQALQVLPVNPVLAPGADNPGISVFWFTFTLSLLFFVGLTNQFHKWTHIPKPPKLVRVLQECNIILSKKIHNQHHSVPFDCNYCITTGWFNPILEVIGFWRGLEFVIQKTTGYVPREDDGLWTAQKKDE